MKAEFKLRVYIWLISSNLGTSFSSVLNFSGFFMGLYYILCLSLLPQNTFLILIKSLFRSEEIKEKWDYNFALSCRKVL